MLNMFKSRKDSDESKINSPKSKKISKSGSLMNILSMQVTSIPRIRSSNKLDRSKVAIDLETNTSPKLQYLERIDSFNKRREIILEAKFSESRGRFEARSSTFDGEDDDQQSVTGIDTFKMENPLARRR